MRTAVLVLVASLAGCRHADPPARAAWSEDAVQGDLRVLCDRMNARSLSAWSQPVYRSTEVRDLTIAIDQGDEPARCRLGALMQERRVSQCRTTAKGLRRSCGA